MNELSNESIDLIVTSPPYWNAIDYDVFLNDKNRDYKTREGGSYNEYLSLLERSFKECFRVLKGGRFCSVIIGGILYNGRNYPIPFDFVQIMKKIGFELHQDIIWNKALVGFKRIGPVTNSIVPGRYYPNLMFEYILVFQKPGIPIYKNRSLMEKEENKVDVDDFFRQETAKNIWNIVPVTPRTMNHPCPFPEEIPFRLISLYSYSGETVLDPFCGAGTTVKVAHHLGRRYQAYDIKKEFLDETIRRLKEPLHLHNRLISAYIRIQK